MNRLREIVIGALLAVFVVIMMIGCASRPQAPERPPARVSPWAEICKAWGKC